MVKKLFWCKRERERERERDKERERERERFITLGTGAIVKKLFLSKSSPL
jgi:hypothetical protein